MAEASQHSSSVTDAAPAAVHSDPGLTAGEGAEPYRPLSLLALAGFLLAVLYATLVTVGGLAVFAQNHPTLLILLAVLVPLCAIVAAMMFGITQPLGIATSTGKVVAWTAVILGLGNLVAYSSSNPWLMPHSMPIWGVLVAAILISWLGRARIRASENTLSGAALATWGLWLSLFFGLLYSGYLAACIVAVRSQARDFADEFLDLLRNGDQLQAFVRTLPQGSRPAGGNIRDTVERQFNTPGPAPTRDGAFSTFCRADLARIISIGGKSTTFDVSSIETDFDKERYRVSMFYKVSGPVGTYNAVVTAMGLATAGSGRRQWNIDPQGTFLRFKMPADEALQEKFITSYAAIGFAREWARKLKEGRLDEAYLDTVDPDQREKQRVDCFFAFPALGGVMGLPAIALRTSASQAFLAGRQSFMEGKTQDGKPFVDAKDVWPTSGPRIRDEVENVRKIFSGSLTAYIPEIDVPYNTGATSIETSGKQVVVAAVSHILFRHPPPTGGPPVYAMECEILVESPVGPSPPTARMRILSVRLLRGRTATPPKEGKPMGA
jgi:hypothetical protein